MAHLDVDVKLFSSVPATVNHREAQPETEPANSEAPKGKKEQSVNKICRDRTKELLDLPVLLEARHLLCGRGLPLA